MRKIIQISGDKALCDDGSVYLYTPFKYIDVQEDAFTTVEMYVGGWEKLPSIPQDEVKDDIPKL